jgi:hypothetical protein
MATALITGATAGIGHHFARLLAAQGFALVLVARDAERLGAVAAELHDRHGVEVETLAADLADREQLERVAQRLRDAARPVDVLINNAGFGLNENLVASPVADEERLLDVLVRAVLVLSKAAVPGMVERGRGRVVTVASVAAFLPGGTYSAAKAWATTFTMSLAGELAGTGVTATAVCPGYTRTEFHQRAELEMSMLPGWAWLSADRVVTQAWADARHGRSVSVPSRRYAAAVMLLRHLPLRVGEITGRRRAARRTAAGVRGRSAASRP